MGEFKVIFVFIFLPCVFWASFFFSSKQRWFRFFPYMNGRELDVLDIQECMHVSVQLMNGSKSKFVHFQNNLQHLVDLITIIIMGKRKKNEFVSIFNTISIPKIHRGRSIILPRRLHKPSHQLGVSSLKISLSLLTWHLNQDYMNLVWKALVSRISYSWENCIPVF